MKFIEKEKYWFDIIQLGGNKFAIFNTQRRLNQYTRDGIGYYISHENFQSLEEAKKYLNSLDKK
jgi:hypothetical protein